MKLFKTFKDYRDSWENAPKVMPSVPLNVDIELSSACNLKCPFCFVSHPKYKSISHKFMDSSLASTIIDRCAEIGVPAMKFNWRGEPTLHPAFGTLLKKASEKNFHDLIVNTNGNYDGTKIAIGLMCATKVIFSVDSFNTNTYAKMRKGGDFFRLINNIYDLLDMGHKGVILRRVVTGENRDEDFNAEARLYFGNKVAVSEHQCFDRSGGETTDCKRVYCGYPSQRLVIDVEGDYHPCCVDTWGDIKLGNFKDIGIREVWCSGLMHYIRYSLKRDRFPAECCRNCTSWMAYKGANRELVRG